MVYLKKRCPMRCCITRNQVWVDCMNGVTKFGYTPQVVASWMDVQKMADGLDLMRSAMGTEYIGPINAL